MIKYCKAVCINGLNQRKAGEVCGEPARHRFEGRDCCWTHYKVLENNSRAILFDEPTPIQLAGAR